MNRVIRSQEEMDDLANAALANEDEDESKYPGKRYEEGVLDTLNWLLNEGEDDPLPLLDE